MNKTVIKESLRKYLVENKVEKVRKIGLSFTDKIEGGFLTKKQSGDLQKEIEANYDDKVSTTTKSGIIKWGQDSNDIRTFIYNYDNPLIEKDLNGVNLRVASGLTEGKPYSGNRRKTYLLYADGNIIGKFYNIEDLKKVVKYVYNELNKPNITEYLNESQDLDIKKMYGWYSSFKDRYYKDIETAYNDIKRVVDHNNKQFGKIFGEDKTEDIIKLFNFIETKKGIKIEPKLKQPKEKKSELEYETDTDLINKQKYLWSDTRGIEIGRYLSKLKYMDTNDSRIYGTEKQEEQNILNIMKKLKNGDELPPILLDYDFGILDGHHRWEAAKRLKIKKIPVIIYENPNEI